MKSTKIKIYEFVRKEICSNPDCKGGIETKLIADKMDMQRSNVSSLLNELVKEGKLIKTANRPVLYQLPPEKQQLTKDFFTRMVGHDGSLQNAVQLAKAAILYPGKCLNVHLLSKMGSGSTFFAFSMFQFAKESGILEEDAPYVKVNCRHYQKNIEALNEEIFGDLEKNCFARAQGGMLFIDNADLMNAKQQSSLFEFIEKGRLSEKNHSASYEYRDIFLVVSCSPDSTLQINRRLPVTIELPELKERPLLERLALINQFFAMESNNANRCIEVERAVLQALLLYDFVHDIKEMELEIKAACANAYVRVINEPERDIVVCLNDLKSDIRKGLLKLKDSQTDMEKLLGSRESFFYDANSAAREYDYMAEEKNEMYAEIKKQYDELAKRGIERNSIEQVVNTHINNLFKKYRYYYDSHQDMEQLAKIVDTRIIQMVSGLLETCKKDLGRSFKSNVFYGLCLHINSLLTLNFEAQRIGNEQIVKIIQEYPKEYAASVQFCELLKKELKLDLPMEEVVLITMFLIDTEENNEERPVLLYIMHGKATASSLCEVTNSLTHCHNAFSYDLALELDLKQALEEIKSLILKIDNGAGVIVLYDMGSIKTMLDIISEEIDVKIRPMSIPVTLIGIDIARKCHMETDIDSIYHMANLEINKMYADEEKHNQCIITLCHTGEGGAIQLKRYIDEYSKLGIKTIPLAISSREKLLKEVMDLRKTFHIHCFVGTYDPKLFGIPFISIGKVFENSPDNLDRILMFEPVTSHTFDYNEVYNYLEEQFKYASIPKLKTVLPGILDEFNILYALDEDQQAGLFIHLIYLVERLLEGSKTVKNKEKNKIISVFEDDYHVICKMLSILEKKFKIIIDDDEIATIIMIVKKI